jgi:hypothetical protein
MWNHKGLADASFLKVNNDYEEANGKFLPEEFIIFGRF